MPPANADWILSKLDPDVPLESLVRPTHHSAYLPPCCPLPPAAPPSLLVPTLSSAVCRVHTPLLLTYHQVSNMAPYQGLEPIPGSLEMRPVAGHPDCPEGLSLLPYSNPSIP